MGEEFLAYVGPPGLHDGIVLAVERGAGDAAVRVRGGDGREHRLLFLGVSGVREHRAEGMMLYALAELAPTGAVRRFVFVNWDEEDDDARLEIDARTMRVEPGATAG